MEEEEINDYFLVVGEYKPNLYWDADVPKFLTKEGFITKGGYYGSGAPWYFVELNKKFFYPGRPGIKFGRVIGNHAITFEEFKIIYTIYKKYNGLEVMKFDK